MNEVVVSERIGRLVYAASWFFVALFFGTINLLCFTIASYIGLELSLVQHYFLSLVLCIIVGCSLWLAKIDKYKIVSIAVGYALPWALIPYLYTP